MDNFADALAAVRDLKNDGVVSEYAVGGAMALLFWSEPTATYDLDVFVLLSGKRGYKAEKEHIEIEGIPVQVIPAPNRLTEEAIANAADLDYDGQPVRVIRPEYLIAMFLEPTARTRKRQERAATLLDEGNLDRRLLDDLLQRYNLALPEYKDAPRRDD